jgi:hypothetical protein
MTIYSFNKLNCTRDIAEPKKHWGIQSFYDYVQSLEGHTSISTLKKEDINSVRIL